MYIYLYLHAGVQSLSIHILQALWIMMAMYTLKVIWDSWNTHQFVVMVYNLHRGKTSH